jgi:small-conductance mechanosensitive channel
MPADKNALYLGGVFVVLGLSVAVLRLLNGSKRLRRREADYPATTALVAFLTLSVVMIGALAGISAGLEAGGYIPGRLEVFFDSVFFSLAITFAALNLLQSILNLRADQTSFVALPFLERQKLKSGFSKVLYLTLGYTFIMAMLRLINAPETVATFATVLAALVLGPFYLRLAKLLMYVSVTKAHYARLFGFVLFVAGILTPLAALLGYVNLAKFIISQLVWVCFVLIFAWLVFVWLEEQFTAKTDTDCLESQTGFTKLAHKFFGLKHQQSQFAGVVLQGLGRFALSVITLLALALPWGGVGENLFSRLSSNLTQFSIAGFPISPLQVVIAIGLFFGGLMLVRLVKSWLTNSFLPLTPLDKGVRDSLSTFFGYVGFVLVALMTLSYMGLALQNLAIIAGALSLGIGFGLQSIVNNFVSGLILLAERPIKVGDWIVVGAEEGNVKKINVRSTEIETFDRASIIVPNADLITGVVKNWMHSNRTGRIRVMIGVAYDADPEQVRDILLECAQEHENILSYPAPGVFFQDFGDNALIFELLAHLGEVSTSMTTRSDLRFAILRKLRAAKIEIPYPQRDIHIRSDVRTKD